MKKVLLMSAWFAVVFGTETRIETEYGVYKGHVNDNGEFDGKGVFRWKIGDVFDGKWKDGEMVTGRSTFHDGDTYEGEWKGDKKNGQGLYRWKDGRRYFGQYKDNQKHGEGMYTVPEDKYIYFGNWSDGAKHGFGMESKNGVQYEGHFQYDQKHGKGTLTQKNDDVLTGEWKHGKPPQGTPVKAD